MKEEEDDDPTFPLPSISTFCFLRVKTNKFLKRRNV